MVSPDPFGRLLWVLGLGVPLLVVVSYFLRCLSFALSVGFGRSAFAAVSNFSILSFVRVGHWVLAAPLSRWFHLIFSLALSVLHLDHRHPGDHRNPSGFVYYSTVASP